MKVSKGQRGREKERGGGESQEGQRERRGVREREKQGLCSPKVGLKLT